MIWTLPAAPVLVLATSLAPVFISDRATAAPEDSPLAFDMPSAEQLDESAPRVFAHFFTAYPISFDNKPAETDYYAEELLPADGESGNHAAYGGLLRQRPLPRPVNPSDDWALDDMKTEVQRATDAGIDGFAVDILSLSGPHWERVLLLLDAASAVDPEFQIVLMPDGNTRTVSDPVALADAVESVADHPSLYRLDDDRLVISPFMPESVGADWWAAWITTMDDRGIAVAFVPVLLDYGGNISAFAEISYGVSVWGGRSPGNISNLAEQAADARSRGLVWMQPLAPQDVRPKSGVFDESNNTETLRLLWATASETEADWVQIVTWNDYSEATEIAPSTNTGWSPLDISAYFLVTFKLGAAPTIARDRIYLSHRVQPVDAVPTGGQTSLMNVRSGSSPPRDQVEVLTFLREGAEVDVTIGVETYTYQAPPGVHAELFPLAVGTVSAEARAPDGTKSTVTSPHEVTDQPVVQDLQYRFAGSGRDEADLAATPSTIPTTVAPTVPGSGTVAIEPGSAPPPTESVGVSDDADAAAPNEPGSNTAVAVVAVLAIVSALAVLAVVLRTGRSRGRRGVIEPSRGNRP
jgi:hypothetical protein